MSTVANSNSSNQGWFASDLISLLRQNWLLVAGFAALAIPTLINAATQYWSTEAGAHSPIVLATAVWLLIYSRRDIEAAAGPTLGVWPTCAFLLLVLPAYVLARVLDILVIEAAAVFGLFLIISARFVGVRGIVKNLFPFSYFLFLIPLPGWALDLFTTVLREWISDAATWLLSAAGYPVSQEGIVIYIAQYQLLVEDACSGMNSIVGLTAISLFYIYILHRANWRHVVLLLLAIWPIAMLANLVRVLILILLTYYAGDAVAQGFAHNMAGIVLFAVALGLMILVDLFLIRFGQRVLRPQVSQ